ncbi:MAG: diacylglycerol kinase family protein [Flavobacteriales bacterium]
MLKFLKGRLLGAKYALAGAWFLIRTEASIQVQTTCAVVVIIAGFYYDISSTEWMIQTLAIALVLAAEGLNTAIEAIADYIQPNHDKKIGIIKDVAAGAVTFAAVSALAIACWIYFPKLGLC